jgi:predicted GNAT superfamily acetyltransferase
MRDLEARHVIGGKKFLLQVETSNDAADYMKYEEIRDEIWKDPLDNFASPRNMAAENYFSEGSSLFIAAYVEDRDGHLAKDTASFVGFSYGFVGIKDKDLGFRNSENFIFYSQYTGVKEGYQKGGLGIKIKEFQRKILTEVFGVFTVICTFDPLTGINAYRNIHHFQMDIVKYHENCYTDFTGKLNRIDVPLDRFLVSWDLKKEPRRSQVDIEELLNSGMSVIQTGVENVSGKTGPLQLDVVTGVDLSLDEDLLLVEIPFDFYTMIQETDVTDNRVREIPVVWRYKTREVFQDLFRRGYSILDFQYIQKEGRKRDFYVLSA